MIHFSSVVATVLLGASAFAQVDASAGLHPITSPVRNAGVYHLATGTWTRHASQASLGSDVVYDNTCSSGYYLGGSNLALVDEGRLPSATSPATPDSRPGCATSYVIDGFQFAFCTDQPTAMSGTPNVSFYASYVACTTVVGLTPTASFAINWLPPTPGSFQCWLVTVDLDSPPLTTSLAFTLQADGDGSYADPATSNLFGWAMSWTPGGVLTGPITAGNPSLCSQFDGTRWDSPVNYAEQGTGMTTQNMLRIESGGVTPGCYDFGPTGPFASLHLELYSDACVGELGVEFCEGSGLSLLTDCPCANNSAPGASLGCLNSFGVGSGLRINGSASLSADTVVMTADHLPAASVLFFQGTLRQNSGNGSVFGDGLRCAGGTLARLGTYTANGTPGSATSSYPQSGDPSVSVRGGITVPGTRTYQAWYRNTAAFCTPAGFNLSNGVELSWGS